MLTGGRTSRIARTATAFSLITASLLAGVDAPPVRAETADATAANRADAAAITTSLGTTCAIITGGDVTCWGSDLNGKLGNGPSTTATLVAPDVPIELPDSRRAIEIVAGELHTCAVMDDRGVTCWGSDADGQLGNGPDPQLDAPGPPIDLPDGLGALAIALGDRHTCALLTDGSVVCWGRDDDGQLGNGALSGDVIAPGARATLPPGRTATAVTAGATHSCALLDDGSVACWGNDADGQVGNGPTAGDVTNPTVIALPGGADAIAVSAGRAHTCAVLDTGDVTCWGDDGVGQLGNGAATGDVIAPPPALSLASDAIGVSAGAYHTCALLDGGDVTCWGLNNDGELGIGSAGGIVDAPPAPITFPPGRTARAVSAGSLYTCALLDDLSMTCWGDDLGGQLGNGAPTGDVDAPAGPITFPYPGGRSLSIGSFNVCAIDQNGALYCWGRNDAGQTGTGSTAATVETPTLVTLPGGAPTAQAAVGTFHTCVLTDASQVYCWGSDAHGALGDGPGDTSSASPVGPIAMPAGEQPVQLAAGYDSTCARFASGNVSCWGWDIDGQAGNGTPTGALFTAPPPIDLPGSTTATDIAIKHRTVCAALNTGRVTCWGSDQWETLGDGLGLVDQESPVPPLSVPGDPDVADVEVTGTGCARTTVGRVHCWGWNLFGSAGVGSTRDRVSTPSDAVALPGGARARSIGTGSSHTCALLHGGSITCWGDDSTGALGDGGPLDDDLSTLPIPPIDLPGDELAVEVATGGATTCAVLASGQVACWGSDSYGQLGNGTPTGAATAPTLIGLDLGDGASVETQLADAAPTQPRSVTADPADRALGVSWLAPASDGGSPVLGYTATAQPGGATCSTNGALGCTISGLTNGTTYSITVVATNAVGTSPPSSAATGTPSAPPTPATTPSIVPIDPARYWDSRPGEPTFDDRFDGTGRPGDQSTFTVEVGGRGDVPAGAKAVVANATAIFPDGEGFATLYSCEGDPPLASSLNYAVGDVVANNLIIPLNADGELCVFTWRAADFALDINGYVPADSPIVPIEPARFLETRPGESTFDTQQAGIGRVGDRTVTEIEIAGRGSIPPDASAALVNLTAIFPDGPGFATLYPCGDLPDASNINYAGGDVTPNAAIVSLSSRGTVCAYTWRGADLILDVSGYVPSGVDDLVTQTPARFLETRPDFDSIDGEFQHLGRTAARESLEIDVVGRNGVPATAAGVIANVAVIFPDGPGFATLYPCGDLPTASNVNFLDTATVRANNVVTKLSPTGTVCVYTYEGADVILDVAGWFEE